MRQLNRLERLAFRHVPRRDRKRARILTVPWLPAGTAGMTLGPLILVRRGHLDRGLLAHELVHVTQWRELGVARFLFEYLGFYLRGRWRRLGHWDSYRQIPLEVAARLRSGYD
jgi:hypothetical protein